MDRKGDRILMIILKRDLESANTQLMNKSAYIGSVG
jgi:hypothetical protein